MGWINDIKEKIIMKINSNVRNEVEESKTPKELDEVEEIFCNAEYNFNGIKLDTIKEITLDKINLETEINNNSEKEQFLKLNMKDVMKIYVKEINESDKIFMEKRGLELSSFLDGFRVHLKYLDFESNNCNGISFQEFLSEELFGYSVTEQEEFQEETYMDRLEIQQVGKEEYVKVYGENNFIDTYIPYYERAYLSYKNLDKEKLYTIKDNVKINNKEVEKDINNDKEYMPKKDLNLEDGSFIEKGTSFFIEGFKDGKYNIHFEKNSNNKYHNELGDDYLFNSKELSDFSKEAWNLSIRENLTQYDLNNILDLELKEFNELVQALIPEDDIKFMEKRNLNISSYTQEYLNQAKEHDFEKEDFMSFYSYLDREITGIMELEYDRYNEETYMERYEEMVLGKSNNMKSNNKNIGIELDIFKSKNNELEME